MNLPTGLTVARIAATPAIALLPFASSSTLRLVAFVLFVLAAVTGDGVFDTLKAVSKLVLKSLA